MDTELIASVATFRVFSSAAGSATSPPTKRDRMATTPVCEGTLVLSKLATNEITYLQVNNFTRAIMPRSRVWRVSESEIVIPATPSNYWLITLKGTPKAIARLDRVMATLCRYEHFGDGAGGDTASEEDEFTDYEYARSKPKSAHVQSAQQVISQSQISHLWSNVAKANMEFEQAQREWSEDVLTPDSSTSSVKATSVRDEEQESLESQDSQESQESQKESEHTVGAPVGDSGDSPLLDVRTLEAQTEKAVYERDYMLSPPESPQFEFGTPKKVSPLSISSTPITPNIPQPATQAPQKATPQKATPQKVTPQKAQAQPAQATSQPAQATSQPVQAQPSQATPQNLLPSHKPQLSRMLTPTYYSPAHRSTPGSPGSPGSTPSTPGSPRDRMSFEEESAILAVDLAEPPQAYPSFETRFEPRFFHPLIPQSAQTFRYPARVPAKRQPHPVASLRQLAAVGPSTLHQEITTVGGYIGIMAVKSFLRKT